MRFNAAHCRAVSNLAHSLQHAAPQLFPPLPCTTLSGRALCPATHLFPDSRATLLLIAFGHPTPTAAHHLRSWGDPFRRQFSDMLLDDPHPGPPRAVELLVHRFPAAFAMAAALFRGAGGGAAAGGSGRGIHARRRDDYLEYCGDALAVVRTLASEKRDVGHAVLVDATGSVRWRGCGEARPNELIDMSNCVLQAVAEGDPRLRAPEEHGMIVVAPDAESRSTVESTAL